MKAKRVNKEREGEEEAWINNHPPRSTIIHQDVESGLFPRSHVRVSEVSPSEDEAGSPLQSLSRWLSLFFISGEAYK